MQMDQTLFFSAKHRLLRHILFWVLFVLLYTFAYGLMNFEFKKKFLHTLLLLISLVPATYFSIYILLEKILFNRKYLLFIALFLISASFFTLVYLLVEQYIIMPYLYGVKNSFFEFYVVAFIRVYAVVVLAAFAKIIKNEIEIRNINQQLTQKNLESELKFLKGQIHPHFLFNTLNNIYSLSLGKNPEISTSILKLSELLKYMLYKTQSKFVMLSKEIELIRNYIALERLRHSENLSISFDIKGSIDKQQIAPLLLLPFIDNAFKHGVRESNPNNWIVVFMEVINDTIKFSVENSAQTIKHSANFEENKGIGLENVKRRLDLLYQGDYSLEIKEGEESFYIKLIIETQNFKSQ